jgi:peptide/nickel transport system substrate-binding protein
MSTDPIRVADPAAITDAASAVVSLNVFQRLMTADPGGSVLKPDAARDLLQRIQAFRPARAHPDTAKILAAAQDKLREIIQTGNVDGSSTSLLSSLRKIDAPDPVTVRFLLSRPDTQFGWALASPAASIVDEEIYPQDDVRPLTEPIIGSGPFVVSHRDDRSLLLTRYLDYVGRSPARIDALDYRTAADSATIEDAMASGKVDVVWRGLNAAAVTRYSQQVAASGQVDG